MDLTHGSRRLHSAKSSPKRVLCAARQVSFPSLELFCATAHLGAACRRVKQCCCQMELRLVQVDSRPIGSVLNALRHAALHAMHTPVRRMWRQR